MKKSAAIIFTDHIQDMRARLKIFLLLILYWLGYMIVIRGLFLAYNYDLTAQLTTTEIFLTMLHGLRMDGSMAGYFLAVSGLLLTVSAIIPGRWIHVALTYTNLVLMIISTLVVVTDMELYRHWAFRMNNTPFFYMGSGALGSVSSDVIIKVLIIFMAMIVVMGWIYIRVIKSRTALLTLPAQKKSAFVLLAFSCFMFVPIRGSFSVAPMNTGYVYFHKTKNYANHAAINVVWNFIYSIRKSSRAGYPENFFDKEKTQKLFSSLYPSSDSTARLWNAQQPNIIFVILESFTADVIEPLGGVKDLCPNFTKLCHEGILFDNFYASGDRTDKGLISILSGYPAQPQTSIIKYPAKTQRLPHLNQYLKKLGYRSSFVYGGDVNFANFRSYLTMGSFDHITGMDDFPEDLNTSKWGVHDHYMFAQALKELDTTRAPFFKVILTLSSHEPFDVPMEPYIKGNDEESLFLNSCHYTDKSIGDFIKKCKQQPWWSNTIVVFTADHGHRHPGNKSLFTKERFRTPLLIIGGPVKKDTVIHTMSGQTDIANTLLAQLDKPSPEFTFSKNILGNKTVPFASFFFTDGYGFVLPGKLMIYDNPGKQFIKEEGTTESDLELSKAYEQMLYSDYNKR
ncbi:LTA synthase family protein [Ohtaekwangia koreensis]|uniref:Phosphoglycerol transferase MdoB n=1 Tax=Ohtaekwangia koreensis TaxID=688867 RepID=A0A1T5K4Q4_9BACT|nr:LTA synthase family protein [Ohtaekwangia koreensis]SKC58505.1 Phosphoglycerol transferase MdoB [Ohtaekwangia koreensis]